MPTVETMPVKAISPPRVLAMLSWLVVVAQLALAVALLLIALRHHVPAVAALLQGCY